MELARRQLYDDDDVVYVCVVFIFSPATPGKSQVSGELMSRPYVCVVCFGFT